MFPAGFCNALNYSRLGDGITARDAETITAWAKDDLQLARQSGAPKSELREMLSYMKDRLEECHYGHGLDGSQFNCDEIFQNMAQEFDILGKQYVDADAKK